MKTAVSVPDSVFEDAERLARQRGMSRSELYSTAIAEYVANQQFVGVRERLDALYGAHPDDSKLDPALARAQAETLSKEAW